MSCEQVVEYYCSWGKENLEFICSRLQNIYEKSLEEGNFEFYKKEFEKNKEYYDIIMQYLHREVTHKCFTHYPQHLFEKIKKKYVKKNGKLIIGSTKSIFSDERPINFKSIFSELENYEVNTLIKYDLYEAFDYFEN